VKDEHGYLNPLYPAALSEFGEPVELPHCGGWVLQRRIPGFDHSDLMGCYPRFLCRDWGKLPHDLAEMDGRYVALSLVTDPFADLANAGVFDCFTTSEPFKRHYAVVLDDSWQQGVKRHHRYYARKALGDMTTEIAADTGAYLDEWLSLYRNLIQRHRIQGIKAFSRDSFEQQLKIPGLLMIVGTMKSSGRVAGIHLVFRHGVFAYSHLSAYSDEGYRMRASYALYWETLAILAAQGVQYFDLGAAAGLEDDPDDGLSKFKKGWANAERLSYLCGRVLDPDAYEHICRRTNTQNAPYFPAYRFGEFG